MLRYLLLLFVCVISVHNAAASGLQDRVKAEVERYFRRAFGVEDEQLQIKYLRLPQNRRVASESAVEIRVYSQRSTKRLGFQTLWAEVLQSGELLEKFPVTVNAAIRARVVVAEQKIGRMQLVAEHMLTTEARLIDRNWEGVCRNKAEVAGQQTKRLIRRGTVIRRDLIRHPPTISRGDRVQVNIYAGHLVIKTKGVAREDGAVGDIIQIKSEPKGERLQAKVRSSELVVVQQEDYP